MTPGRERPPPWLSVVSLAFWVLRHFPDDENAWVHSGVALLLCLLPAALTFVLAERTGGATRSRGR